MCVSMHVNAGREMKKNEKKKRKKKGGGGGGGKQKRTRTYVLLLTSLKPVRNWANICFAEHSSEYSSNFTSFLN